MLDADVSTRATVAMAEAGLSRPRNRTTLSLTSSVATRPGICSASTPVAERDRVADLAEPQRIYGGG